MSIDFDTRRFVNRTRLGLMRCLGEHRSETEELSFGGLVNDHFLIVFIDGRDADSARANDVSAKRSVADLIYPLARAERLQFYLRRQDREFFIIEQPEERHLFEGFDITGHGGFSSVVD
jgi:hypothetical protein